MKFKRIRVLVLLSAVLFYTFAQTAHAQTSKSEDPRLSRLAGLAKVWGTVKYFHPYLAYRNIDWDKALVEAIPKVNAAKTPQEYQAAINQMLAVLNDSSTRATIEVEDAVPDVTATALPAGFESKLVRTENQVLVIDADGIGKAISKDTSALNRLVGNINQALTTATGVVIDARSNGKAGEIEAFYFDVFMRQTLPSILDTDVVLSSQRYRMHNGYATQTATGASFYYSAMANSAPQTIEGRAKTKTPIVFIVNQHSPSFTEMLGGLQSANRALVIHEGEQPEGPAGNLFKIEVPDNVKVRMRTSELVNPDGSLGFQPDVVLPQNEKSDAAIREGIQALKQPASTTRKPSTQALASQVAQKDNPYPDMEFPTVEYRLLALFRYWNVINYFFPYKHLIGDSWSTVLTRYIPKFEVNRDAADYQLTVRELVTEMQDSHGGVRNANAAAQKLGMFLPAVLFGHVEGKSVVTKVLDDTLPIKVGDEVLAIDGEPVEKRREFLSRYVATSTPQWLMKHVNLRLLMGAKDSVAKVRVRDPKGEVREVSLARSLPATEPKLQQAMERSTPVIQVLPSGYGYVDLDRLQGAEVGKMFDTIKDTPAVIFDMRGYPNGTAWSIAPRLTAKKNVVAALFSRPLLEATSLNAGDLEQASYSFVQKLPEPQGEPYKGRVVMLINEDAISQSEHTCLFFAAATDVTFIGTPTAGANGDVTMMVLPGNLQISFTGHNVRHADGRQLQRLGIQPHIKVERTIRGIVDGRDEILEAAVKHLNAANLRK
ncbi:MAG TPA: S41 family peptidase [Pyrinomonadaceae bacterium]|nr:S41 family peptidase [Pyrinomonadaceae bacterium]